MLTGKFVVSGCFAAILSVLAGPALADGNNGGSGGCRAIPNLGKLKGALISSITPANGANGGLGFNMWGTIVDTSGIVCAVAFSGSTSFTQQWLGSRVISAQKANTANAFSLGSNSTPPNSLFPQGLALSTANLFSAVQPGGSLYGLQHSNPVDTDVAYGNQPGIGPIDPPPTNAGNFGTAADPMIGQRIGGVNVFGGGLAIYVGGVRVGGLGVSGDTSCTDHMVAWRTRNTLGLDGFSGVGGVSDAAHPDNIIFDITPNPDGTGGTGQAPNGTGGVGQSASGFGHPKCLNNPTAAAVSGLPAVH
jgi:Haem-degrading